MNENTNETTSQKMSDFIIKQKKVLLSILLLAVVVVVGITVISSINNSKKVDVSNSTTKLIELFAKASATGNEDDSEFVDYANNLIIEQKGTKAELLAYSRLASYYFDNKKFQEALDNYTLAYTNFPNDIATSVNMFNAAMANDELGNIDESITILEALVETYKSSTVDGVDSSSDVPEAIFNLGRLYEEKNDTESAILNYEILVSEYNSYNLSGLAKSRLIVIK